jgi:hypothetical protein
MACPRDPKDIDDPVGAKFLLICAVAMIVTFFIARCFSMIGENRDFMMQESCRRAYSDAVVSQLDDGARVYMHYGVQGRTPEQIKELPHCKGAF